MNLHQITDVIATRRLEHKRQDGTTEDIRVTLGKPEPRSEGGTYCPYSIKEAGIDVEFYAVGIDSVHALQGAMYLIGAHLENHRDDLDGELRWDAGEDGELGFPTKFV
jgi:hypothetical protein